MNVTSPSFKISYRSDIFRRLKGKYNSLQAIYKVNLNEVQYLSLTMYIWTDIFTQSYHRVTIHFEENSKLTFFELTRLIFKKDTHINALLTFTQFLFVILVVFSILKEDLSLLFLQLCSFLFLLFILLETTFYQIQSIQLLRVYLYSGSKLAEIVLFGF